MLMQIPRLVKSFLRAFLNEITNSLLVIGLINIIVFIKLKAYFGKWD